MKIGSRLIQAVPAGNIQIEPPTAPIDAPPSNHVDCRDRRRLANLGASTREADSGGSHAIGEGRAKHTVPTGLSGNPRRSAIPETATARSVPSTLLHPDAIARATSSETAPRVGDPFSRNMQQFRLRKVRVRHQPALEENGRTGNGSQQLADQPSGARFRGR